MTHPDIKLRVSIGIAALLVSGGPLHSTMAQGVNSLPDGPGACHAFRRSGYGSWTVLRPATIYPSGVALSLPAGQTFGPNQLLAGFDVKAILDRNCGNS